LNSAELDAHFNLTEQQGSKLDDLKIGGITRLGDQLQLRQQALELGDGKSVLAVFFEFFKLWWLGGDEVQGGLIYSEIHKFDAELGLDFGLSLNSGLDYGAHLLDGVHLGFLSNLDPVIQLFVKADSGSS
jgi:hypothetical protein